MCILNTVYCLLYTHWAAVASLAGRQVLVGALQRGANLCANLDASKPRRQLGIRQSPRTDNSKDNIIDLFNTIRVDYLIVIHINYMLFNISDISIWIGKPKPQLRLYRLAAGVSFFEEHMVFSTLSVLVKNVNM